MSLVIAFLLIALYRVDLKRRQLRAQLIGQEYVALLGEIAYSYAPLKFIEASEQYKAVDLLHDHLGSSLDEYREFLKTYPEIKGGRDKLTEDAQALFEKIKKTEQGSEGTSSR